MADGNEPDELRAVGLCATCTRMRVMRSDRGSVFYLCELSKIDQRFPKYPRLPVLSCLGYEKREDAAASLGLQNW